MFSNLFLKCYKRSTHTKRILLGDWAGNVFMCIGSFGSFWVAPLFIYFVAGGFSSFLAHWKSLTCNFQRIMMANKRRRNTKNFTSAHTTIQYIRLACTASAVIYRCRRQRGFHIRIEFSRQLLKSWTEPERGSQAKMRGQPQWNGSCTNPPHKRDLCFENLDSEFGSDQQPGWWWYWRRQKEKNLSLGSHYALLLIL